MGMLSRRKGRSYEQRIGRMLREQWPGVEVRRSMQNERAFNSDLYVVGGSSKLERLWLELCDGRKPDPNKKLQQAEYDIAMSAKNDNRLPVVVWHRIGERTSYATTRLWVLDAVRGVTSPVRSEAVTMPLEQFLDVLSGGVR